MFSTYLQRGAIAGTIGGLAFGLYVYLVSTPLVRALESYEGGGAGHSHDHGSSAAELSASATSVLGGVLFGIVLGTLVFGVAYYLFEPTIPGPTTARSYLLGVAGFFVVSGAPWFALPPRPPGVESALATDIRIVVYAGMMLLGLGTCVLAQRAYASHRDGKRARTIGFTLTALTLVPAAAALVPTGVVHSPAPEALAAGFRWSVIFGQLALWFVLASTHAALVRWSQSGQPTTQTDTTAFSAD